jgi:DNA-binding response OmpR family regulator
MSNLSQILVVDDDEEIGIMLKLTLEHRGFPVIVLQRPEQAEEAITQNNIGLIILDMLIGGVKGTDVCLRLKGNSSTAHIPVMMLTAIPDAEVICKDAGADEFLSKPFEMNLLISKIKQWV